MYWDLSFPISHIQLLPFSQATDISASSLGLFINLFI